MNLMAVKVAWEKICKIIVFSVHASASSVSNSTYYLGVSWYISLCTGIIGNCKAIVFEHSDDVNKASTTCMHIVCLLV